MTLNLTLDPWQVATLYALYLQLIFFSLASAPAPRAVGSEWDTPCRE